MFSSAYVINDVNIIVFLYKQIHPPHCHIWPFCRMYGIHNFPFATCRDESTMHNVYVCLCNKYIFEHYMPQYSQYLCRVFRCLVVTLTICLSICFFFIHDQCVGNQYEMQGCVGKWAHKSVFDGKRAINRSGIWLHAVLISPSQEFALFTICHQSMGGRRMPHGTRIWFWGDK